jgi:hypothetical protein
MGLGVFIGLSYLRAIFRPASLFKREFCSVNIT